MGQDSNTLRSQSDGYKKRLVEPVSSRTLLKNPTRPVAAYRVTKKSVPTGSIDVISAPKNIANNTIAHTSAPVPTPVTVHKKMQQTIAAPTINKQVSTPANKLKYRNMQAQKKMMKHIPTLPAP